MKLAGLVILALVSLAILPSLPYGYYGIMRWLVSASMLYLVIQSFERGSRGWAWAWAVFGGIYNPIFPVHAGREIWTVVNIATIVAVLAHLVATGVWNRPDSPT